MAKNDFPGLHELTPLPGRPGGGMNQHTTQFLANCARTVSFISTARDQEYQARSGLFRRPVNKRACASGHFVSSIHRRPLKRGEIKGRKGHLRKKPPFKINVWTCGDAGARAGAGGDGERSHSDVNFARLRHFLVGVA